MVTETQRLYIQPVIFQKEEIKIGVGGRERGKNEKEGEEICQSRWMLVRPVPLPHGGFLLLNLIFTHISNEVK